MSVTVTWTAANEGIPVLRVEGYAAGDEAIHGEIDRFRARIENDPRDLIVSLVGVHRIDARLLGELAGVSEKVGASGRRLVVVWPPADRASLFLLRAGGLRAACGTEEEAIALLRGTTGSLDLAIPRDANRTGGGHDPDRSGGPPAAWSELFGYERPTTYGAIQILGGALMVIAGLTRFADGIGTWQAWALVLAGVATMGTLIARSYPGDRD